MMRYALHLAFDGTNYHGWQRQPSTPSVQAALEAALLKVTKMPIRCTGCGRTDAGVHAEQYVAHFDVVAPLPDHFLENINRALPPDIAVYDADVAAPDFHARFDAVARAYDYRLHTQKYPVRNHNSTYWPELPPELNRTAMQQAADALTRYRDFGGLCKAPDRHRTTLCDVREAQFYFDEAPHSVRFHIRANRFIRGMVRLTVGQLMRVGQGRLSADEFEAMLAEGRRPEHFVAAPPQGLTLSEVVYQ